MERDKSAIGKLEKIAEELKKSNAHHYDIYKSSGGKTNFDTKVEDFVPRKSFSSEKDFKDYLSKLSPYQKKIVRELHLGEE